MSRCKLGVFRSSMMEGVDLRSSSPTQQASAPPNRHFSAPASHALIRSSPFGFSLVISLVTCIYSYLPNSRHTSFSPPITIPRSEFAEEKNIKFFLGEVRRRKFACMTLKLKFSNAVNSPRSQAKYSSRKNTYTSAGLIIPFWIKPPYGIPHRTRLSSFSGLLPSLSRPQCPQPSSSILANLRIAIGQPSSKSRPQCPESASSIPQKVEAH